MDSSQLTILYGSQTGNAEDMSKRIGHKAKSLGFRVLVETMDDFPLKLLPRQRLVVFVCSTTGHGQEPENMKNFYNFIRRRDLPKGCLSSLRFAVYGLGDSSYAKFNYVAKILHKRLKECGAQPVQELVTGDDQHQLGCDGIIYPKLDELWSKLDDLLSSGGFEGNPTSELPENSYSVTLHQADNNLVPDDEYKEEYIERYNMKTAYCVTNKRITPDSHFQDTRLLCFKAVQSIEYEPGDVCTILPANLEENTRQFIETLGLDPEQRLSMRKKDSNYMVNYLYDFVPDGLKIGDLVKYYLDIQSVPKRSFFEFWWPFSTNELEKNKLREFASTEGQEEMYEYCVQPKRSILEVLLDFPHSVKNIKFEYLLDMIPPIKPRSFSIASALSCHPSEIHLIVGVVNYQTRLRKIRKGLCSNYLAQLKTVDSFKDKPRESKLRFFIRRSSFKLPRDHRTPIIMIGPGLGIAPFRSFIEERSTRTSDGPGPRNNHLYFGCRYKDADFYFEEELTAYSSQGIIKLKVAFSREDPKQYVQDLLLEDSDLVLG